MQKIRFTNHVSVHAKLRDLIDVIDNPLVVQSIEFTATDTDSRATLVHLEDAHNHAIHQSAMHFDCYRSAAAHGEAEDAQKHAHLGEEWKLACVFIDKLAQKLFGTNPIWPKCVQH